jgi:hypothetical protein
MGNWDSDRVSYWTPYLEGNKFTILEDGEKLCEELGLEFDEVYRRTNTSYKPLQHIIETEPGYEWYGQITNQHHR